MANAMSTAERAMRPAWMCGKTNLFSSLGLRG
jgi:hypothetical protein